MALPKKKRGFRTIIVKSHAFQWNMIGHVEIRAASQKANRLMVDYGWFDEWLYINDPHNKPDAFEPKIVTPKFVQLAIEFALDHGWDMEKKVGVFKMTFEAGVFKLM